MEQLATEDEQRHKLEDITATLATLKERLENANEDIKRQVVENLVQEIRVGKVDDGTPALKIVYAFSSDKESDHWNNQLHHEPMCVRLLWRIILALLANSILIQP